MQTVREDKVRKSKLTKTNVTLATLSRDKNGKCDMVCHTTSFPNRAALYSVQLCRKNAVNADWSILVYAKK